jgi:SAM-dependent methyltransferase
LNSYRDPRAPLADVLTHLRNKNLDVFPAARSLRLSVAERLVGWAARQRAAALAAGPWEVVVSEQTIEVPLVMAHLGPTVRSVLDFGGFESTLPLSLCGLGCEVTVLDQRHYPFVHPRLRTVTADLLAPEPPMRDQFDAVISSSTIEHVGLQHYGDIPDRAGDARAIARLSEMVKPGGRLLVTLPAGRPVVQRGYRVYDAERVRNIFPPGFVAQWFRKSSRFAHWEPADPEVVQHIVYGAPHLRMPAEAVVFVRWDRPL